MITVDFSRRGGAGLCDFLCNSIRSQIRGGQLSADEKLPSKRALAAHLGVSVITVQNAYEQLIGEGYIYSIEKKGFFVTDIALDGVAEDYVISAEDCLPSSAAPATANESTSTASVPLFFDFRNNATASERFPFSQWTRVMRSVLAGGDQKLLQRQTVSGIYELRLAISRYLASFRNMQVSPEQIIIGAGTESLYSMLVQFFGSTKTFAVENPGYHKIAKIFEANGAKTIPIQIDRQGIPPLLLEENQIDIVHISPSHHFPTGRVMPIRRRLELLNWAEQNPSRFIIEDDYDSEFRFAGKPLPTMQTGSTDRVIYVNTFSKTIAPSFRISYMILPPSLSQSFQKNLGFYSCPVSAFEQFTLARFIDAGLYERHLIRMKNYYRNLRNAFIYALEKSRISSFITIQEEEAGLHFLLNLKTQKTGQELKSAFLSQGLNLPLLSEFYYGRYYEEAVTGGQGSTISPPDFEPAGQAGSASFPGARTFVINYSALEKEKIPAIVQRMEKALQ